MTDSLFDIASDALERLTEFDRLEARGTLRIALKGAGLAAETATLAQLEVVFKKVMPELLEKRGVSDAVTVCSAVVTGLPSEDLASADGSADEIFGRLGGR